jgi:fucose 4-O-acetylase-like acetyltransferase
VLGHETISPLLQGCIYLFHMPLFFFISGYLHTVKPDLKAFWRKKTIHLLVPYGAFLLLLYPLQLIRAARHLHEAGHPLAHAVFAGFWGGDELRGPYGVFWFLPCLFLTQQLFNMLLARYRLVIVECLVVAALALSYCEARYFPHLSLPLDAHVVLAALPFFLFGYLSKQRQMFSKLWIFPLVFAGVFVGIWLERLAIPLSYNMRGAVYGIPGITLVLALCFIGAAVGTSILAGKAAPLRALLVPLGEASMGIMFIHKQLPIIPAVAAWSNRHGYVASLVFTLISLVITLLLQRNSASRALLLGSEEDFHRLFRIGSTRQKEQAAA